MNDMTNHTIHQFNGKYPSIICINNFLQIILSIQFDKLLNKNLKYN